MAKKVLLDPQCTIGGVDLTGQVKSISFDYGAEAKDTTASGDGTKTYLPGLKDWSATVEFFQDRASGSVDATLFDLVGTLVAITARDSAAVVGATNPEFQGNAILTKYQPIGGSIGDAEMAPVSFQGSGVLTRAVA